MMLLVPQPEAGNTMAKLMKAHVDGIPLEPRSGLQWVGDIPARGATLYPDRTALAFADNNKSLSYAALRRYSSAFAQELGRRGLQESDRIAYLGRNSDLFYPVLFGAIYSGVVLVPLNWRQTVEEVTYQLLDSEAKLLLVDADLLDSAHRACLGLPHEVEVLVIDGLPHESDHLRTMLERSHEVEAVTARHDPRQTILQVYTSGTTGQPKGVLISHEALSLARYAEIVSPDWDDWVEGGITLSAMPNFHVAGLSWVIIGLIRMATVVITADPRPELMLKLIREYSVERSFIVPTAIRSIIDELQRSQSPAPELKALYYGAMPMSEALLRDALSLFRCKFGQFFGMTEVTGTVTYLSPDQHALERPALLKSVGRPIAGVSLEIRDSSGQLCHSGVPGEIWIRSPALMQGYWKSPEKTAEVVMDGWYTTGDGGYLDEQGFLFLTDRIKDMIVSGGENIYPTQIENVLQEHPSVMSAAVIGLPDEVWGERVVAVVELRPASTATEAELRGFVRSRVASYKCPRVIHFSSSLPRTASGKVQRGKIRSQLAEFR